MDAQGELRLIAAGDRNAFARLYRALAGRYLSYATGLLAGDKEAAEDVVDEAFIAVWWQADRFDERGSADGWMRRIVRNKAIDWIRKQRDMKGASDAEALSMQNIPDPAPSPYDRAAQQSDAAYVRRLLQGLSLEHREVIWLCYFEDKSVAEISDIVGRPENTVKTRLFYARKHIREAGVLSLN